MQYISFISLSSALMWTAYANLIPQVHGRWESVRSWLTSLFHIQDKETGGLLQSRSEGARDIITELDLVAAREQLQDLDARETVKGDAEGEDLEARGGGDTSGGGGGCVIG
ncbi:hypothetical protein B0H14DRAFT_2585376 [Mycena olivaceomarginata]|nr:hypothetical protein B0H14DRAFT_2585376 [Mycena olivaceomarginata]